MSAAAVINQVYSQRRSTFLGALIASSVGGFDANAFSFVHPL